MTCQETHQLLHAYVDGELDLMTALEIEQHLQECSACAHQRDALQALRTKLQTELPAYAATNVLRARVRTALRKSAPSAARPRFSTRRWLALAACVAMIILVGWGLAYMLDLVANHVRSRMPVPKHQFDVESTDRHTVKPWLEGQLDYSPPVLDVAAEGFPLVGGRLDYADHRTVAAVVYQRRQHVINLFIWPARPSAEGRPQVMTRQGYQLVHWTHKGMTLWAVSDLEAAELEDFARLFQAKAD